MGIASLHFQNFKVFKDATLPLGRVTLIIGANGTGKSTCMSALRLIHDAPRHPQSASDWVSLGVPESSPIKIAVQLDEPPAQATIRLDKAPHVETGERECLMRVDRVRVFSFSPGEIAKPVSLRKSLDLQPNGGDIPIVLTTLQDQFPERFEAINSELVNWLPEFDRILLDTPSPLQRAFLLRTKEGRHRVPAPLLSEGTLISIALLTLCHLPERPPLIGIEDPDRGMHPRLLRDVLDAVHRLSHPEDFGDDRPPVQVVMTTHSPYFLDLFHDRLEDVVIAEKQGLWSTLRQLSTIPNVEDIVRDAHLGESWFNGVLGGVPAHT